MQLIAQRGRRIQIFCEELFTNPGNFSFSFWNFKQRYLRPSLITNLLLYTVATMIIKCSEHFILLPTHVYIYINFLNTIDNDSVQKNFLRCMKSMIGQIIIFCLKTKLLNVLRLVYFTKESRSMQVRKHICSSMN